MKPKNDISCYKSSKTHPATKLSLHAWGLLGILTSLSQNTQPVRWTLIKASSNISKNSFYKYVGELKEAGIINIDKDNETGVNIYYAQPIYIDSLSKREIALPAILFEDKNIETKTKGLFLFLSAYSGTNLKKEKILDALDITEKTYYVHLNKLIDGGYVKVLHNRNTGGTFAHSEYEILV